MAHPQLVLMGRCTGAFGLKGEVRVFSYAQDPEVFRRAPSLQAGPNPEQTRPLSLISLRSHAGRLLMRFKEAPGRTEAEELKGLWLYLEPSDLGPLAEGEYYWYQLAGAPVHTKAGRLLGTVLRVEDTGAHDILLVSGGPGELMIPVVEEMVLEIGPQGVVVDLPPGLCQSQDWSEE